MEVKLFGTSKLKEYSAVPQGCIMRPFILLRLSMMKFAEDRNFDPSKKGAGRQDRQALLEKLLIVLQRPLFTVQETDIFIQLLQSFRPSTFD